MKSLFAAVMLLFSMHWAHADYTYNDAETRSSVTRSVCEADLRDVYDDEYNFMISHSLARGESQVIGLSGVAGTRYGNLARYHYPSWDVSALRSPDSLRVAADCYLSIKVKLFRDDSYETLVKEKYAYGVASMDTSAPDRFRSARIKVTRPSVVSPTPSPSGC